MTFEPMTSNLNRTMGKSPIITNYPFYPQTRGSGSFFRLWASWQTNWASWKSTWKSSWKLASSSSWKSLWR